MKISGKIADIATSLTDLLRLFDAVKAGVVVNDLQDNRIIYINSTAALMKGVPEEDLIGKKCFQYLCEICSDDCPVNQGEITVPVEQNFPRADGSYLPILKSAYKISLGNHSYLVETLIDISQVRRFEYERDMYMDELKLRGKQQRLVNDQLKKITRAIDVSNEGILIIGRRGNIEYQNRALSQLLGVSEVNEGYHLLLKKLIKPEDPKVLIRRLVSQEGLNQEIRIINAQGHPMTLLLKGSILRTPQGRMISAILLFVDINTLVETRERLKRSERNLDLALYAAHAGILTWYQQSDFLTMDSSLFELMGIHKTAVISKKEDFLSRVASSDREKVSYFINHPDVAGERIEARLQIQENRYIWALITKISTESQWIGMVWDIDQRKEQEIVSGILNQIQGNLLKSHPIEKKIAFVQEILNRYQEDVHIGIWQFEQPVSAQREDRLKIRGFYGMGTSLQEDSLDPQEVLNQVFTHEEDVYFMGESEDLGALKKLYLPGDSRYSYAFVRFRDGSGSTMGLLFCLSLNQLSTGMKTLFKSLDVLVGQALYNHYAQEQLEKSRMEALMTNQRLTTIEHAVDGSSDGVAISTLEGDFYYVNDTLGRMVGLPKEEVLLEGVVAFLEDVEDYHQALEAAAKGDSWQHESIILTKEGGLPVSIRTAPFQDRGSKKVGVIWSFIDILDWIAAQDKIKNYTSKIEASLKAKQHLLSRAHQLQRNLIQSELPVMDEFLVEALYMPSESLGGDFFMVKKGISQEKLVIILGDCTGHGIEASMESSLISSIVNKHLDLLFDKNKPGRFMEEVDKEYAALSVEGDYPTMFVAIIDLKTRQVGYANANSPLPFVTGPEGLKVLPQVEGNHLNIGYFPDPVYGVGHYELQPGEQLIFYSDSLLEFDKVVDLSHSVWRLKTLLQNWTSYGSLGFTPLLSAIQKLSSSLPLPDDTTLIRVDCIEGLHWSCSFSSLKEWDRELLNIRKFLVPYGYSPEDIEEIAISLDELCINAFVHGNQEDSEKVVLVEGSVSALEVTFSITDEGPGFSPESVPDPLGRIDDHLEEPDEILMHGRGIWVVRNFCHSLEYNEKGNQVKIRKKRRIPRVREI